MSYINNGVIKNGSKIGTAIVDSSGLLKKGWMIPYVSFTPSSVTINETDMPNVSSEQIYKSLKNGKIGKYDFKLKEGDIIEVGYVLNGWASIWVEGDMGYINTSSKYIKLL